MASIIDDVQLPADQSNFPTTALDLRESLRPIRAKLVGHRLYSKIRTIDDLRLFLEHHVFAVWDFMSLLKWLQRSYTCVETPWLPSRDPLTRRLINEIVLAEESDDDGEGGYTSHFEMYLAAMNACHASAAPISALVQNLAEGASIESALERCGGPAAATTFVRSTMQLIHEGNRSKITAAFALGREDVIPDMFRMIVADLEQQFPGELATLRLYLERHISLDEETHTPLALRMLTQVASEDENGWRDAHEAAQQCLLERLRLWDAIADALDARA